jgi:thermostable 8-oxoguanine DNA glycosylase
MRYWARLIPSTDNDRALRWVFAFLSIHTSWKKNVESYLEIEKMHDPYVYTDIYDTLKRSKCGLENMRARAVHDLKTIMNHTPHVMKPLINESLVVCRNRLAKYLYGIGLAKTAFALELIYPFQNEVVCLDTHMLKMYSQPPGTPRLATYLKIEQHWTETCNKLGYPPTIARHIYWDQVQNQKDTSYWSFVFHNPQKNRSFV